MPSSQRQKGFGYERELVKQFKEVSMEAKRAWGSNGAAMGWGKETDIMFFNGLKFQCKRPKKLPDWLGMTDNVDAVIVREDNGKSQIMIHLDTFIKLMQGTYK